MHDEVEQELCTLMDQLTSDAFALRPPRQDSVSGIIRTQIVCDTPTFELVIFIFPAGAAIPLHDHPTMAVFSKVLYGSLEMSSFDWEVAPTKEELTCAHAPTRSCQRNVLALWCTDGAHARHAGLSDESARLESKSATAKREEPLLAPRAALHRISTVLTPESPTFCLRPTFANIHSFVAREATAIVDLLLPPYDENQGRDCHYFEQCEPLTSPASDSRHLLRVIGSPPQLTIRGQQYGGPRVYVPTGR